MKKPFLCITLGLSCVAILISAAFFAGAAYAADAKFDSAADNLIKARALLNAAENPGFDPPFNYHRQNAVRHINSAIQDIQRAKIYADFVNPPA